MVHLQVIVLTLNWSSVFFLAEVTGYVLLLTGIPHRGRCGGEGVADLNECECANITNPVGYIIYIYYMRGSFLYCDPKHCQKINVVVNTGLHAKQ